MSEQHRHQCEVRACLKRARGRFDAGGWFDGYADDVAKKRGKPAAEALRVDVLRQAGFGNKGELGSWHNG